MKKQWWKSKTVWANVIATAALIAQSQYGFVIPAEIQGYALIGVNFILRIITKTELVG